MAHLDRCREIEKALDIEDTTSREWLNCTYLLKRVYDAYGVIRYYADAVGPYDNGEFARAFLKEFEGVRERNPVEL